MIKSHHSLLLRRLFSTPKDNKNCQRLKILNKTKISPTPCFTNEKYRQHCACKRRRKDIDLTIKNKCESNSLQCQQEVNL